MTVICVERDLLANRAFAEGDSIILWIDDDWSLSEKHFLALGALCLGSLRTDWRYGIRNANIM